ncbi:MAG: SPFH domain-containing protein [Candidatus Riflebacteria bacterium]|nr:SPFH domain-containing protein [Candidatus Riflebacteria bacterium]MBF0500505.1 SPFH domain-containing protein [Candidatus Riflebacteria bacterium]
MIWESFTSQLRSVIEWKDPPADVLIYRWDGSDDELKNASKLLVGPGQAALFVYEGRVEAIHTNAGLFDIKTANIPFWTTLTKIMQGFQSEHKAYIYFVRTTTFLNQKWGTKAPIKYDDPKYKFPVGLRAFGNFSLQITDPASFLIDFSSTRGLYRIDEIRAAIVDRILTPLTDILAESGFSYAEIDKNRMELSAKLKEALKADFTALGFDLSDFRIENTDFDEDTKKRIDKISDKIADAHAIRALGDIDARSMGNYAAVEQLRATNTAAGNTNGAAGMGVGFGAGMGLGQGMAGMFQQPMASQQHQSQAATITCGACQAPMDPGAKFCPSCGKPNMQGKTNCTACAKPMPAGAKFCPECGATQASAKCPGCKAEIAPGTKFCPGCGQKI